MLDPGQGPCDNLAAEFPDAHLISDVQQDRRKAMTDLVQLRQDLVERLAELGHRVEEFEHDLREPLEADFAEQATQMETSEVTSALEHTAILQAQQIKSAIERIDAGSYGECANCGNAINPERLRVRPYATKCVDCAA
jgi:RNA polymerase-binding transcription factor DksA